MESYQEVPTKDEEAKGKKKKFKLVPGSFPQIVAVTISKTLCVAVAKTKIATRARHSHISHAMSKADVAIENQHVLAQLSCIHERRAVIKMANQLDADGTIVPSCVFQFWQLRLFEFFFGWSAK